jgi:pimeloyl-ACP methyl ester carboxylesterase
MARLGYQRYGAVGNDAGSMISPELGRIDPDHVVGVHVTQLFSFPSGDPAEMKDLSPEEQSQLQTLQWFYENKFSFNTLLSQQPQTIGYAIDDSPLGLAGFGGDFFGLRRLARRDHANIVHWKTYDHGGHFAAHKVPELYVPDVRAFFRSIVR